MSFSKGPPLHGPDSAVSSPRLTAVRNPSASQHSSAFAPSDDEFHNGEQWASAPTVDPWDPNILTLDGGGIRGYSSLLIMEALMARIAVWEEKLRPKADADADTGNADSKPVDPDDLLPCHYFDYMYGTSTGGLIATMLGRLRMSVRQCLEIYREVGESLFGKQRSKIPLTTKYHHKPLVRAVQDIIRAHCKQHPGLSDDASNPSTACDGNDWHPWNLAIPPQNNKSHADFNHHICQSICLTAVHNGKIDEAHLLRTYDHRYVDIPNWITPYNEGADPLRIWQVTRATSAAPFYFDTLEADVRNERWSFKDGGIRENNPAGAAWSEFVSLYGEGKDPAVLLSIGTGRPNENQDGFASAWPGPLGGLTLLRKFSEKFAVLKNVLVKYTDGEQKHKDMKRVARGENTWYKRLNVSAGLEAMPLDEWKRGPWRDPKTNIEATVPGGNTLSHMERVTRDYLDRPIDMHFDTYARPGVMLEHVAEKLVRQRMARKTLADRGAGVRRWDVYNGHYLTGEYAAEPDGPVMHPVKKNPTIATKAVG